MNTQIIYILAIVFGIIGALMAIITVFLYFFLDIRMINAELSGKNRQKEIKVISRSNGQVKDNKAYQRILDAQPASVVSGKNLQSTETSNSTSRDVSINTVLEDNGTVMEETSIDDSVEFNFSIIENVIVIHSDNLI